MKKNELVYSLCSDLVLNLSPEEFYKQRNDISFERQGKNFNHVYLDNRKELLCIELDNNQPKVIYTA